MSRLPGNNQKIISQRRVPNMPDITPFFLQNLWHRMKFREIFSVNHTQHLSNLNHECGETLNQIRKQNNNTYPEICGAKFWLTPKCRETRNLWFLIPRPRTSNLWFWAFNFMATHSSSRASQDGEVSSGLVITTKNHTSTLSAMGKAVLWKQFRGYTRVLTLRTEHREFSTNNAWTIARDTLVHHARQTKLIFNLLFSFARLLQSSLSPHRVLLCAVLAVEHPPSKPIVNR